MSPTKFIIIRKKTPTILIVHELDIDHQLVTHELLHLDSQMKQSVIQSIKSSLESSAALKKRNHTAGSLRYKSEHVSINLQQHRVTYRFNDEHHIGIQGFNASMELLSSGISQT